MPKPISDLPETQVTPNPLLEKRSRRTFSAEYKLRIITGAAKGITVIKHRSPHDTEHLVSSVQNVIYVGYCD